ncbi:MAG: CPBP family intramembrane metalloprotease [Chloroflexi bacterium]|nr:MAG: CPBP family intramembrane metalloprotease [Chloroflexota bacterium]
MNQPQPFNRQQSQPKIPWTVRDVVLGLILALVWVFLVGIAGQLSEYFGLPVDPGVIVILGTLLLLVPVWFFTIRKYGVTWAQLGLRGFSAGAVGMGCGLMLASLLFNVLYGGFLALFDLQIQPDVSLLFNNTDLPVALLFGGAIVAPIVEEIFFRGFVFAGLRNKWNWKIAAVVSAGLFALAHVIPTSFLPIFILGMIFAYLYQISGSVWPGIIMHMLTNTAALGAAYAVSQGWVPTP